MTEAIRWQGRSEVFKPWMDDLGGLPISLFPLPAITVEHAGQITTCEPGDWIVRDGEAFRVVTNGAYEAILAAAMPEGTRVIPPRHVQIPATAEEARMMWLLGEDFVRRHAPEMLVKTKGDVIERKAKAAFGTMQEKTRFSIVNGEPLPPMYWEAESEELREDWRTAIRAAMEA